MRRPTRTRRLSIAAIVSLALFIPIAALWAQSYRMYYTEVHQRARVEGQKVDYDTYALRVCDGSLYFHHEVARLPFNPAVKISLGAAKQLLESRGSTYAFVKQAPWDGANWPGDPNGWHVPLWIPLLLLLIAPVRWLIAHPANAAASISTRPSQASFRWRLHGPERSPVFARLKWLYGDSTGPNM